MIISCIAAVAKNGVIGRNGELPWHLPADLRRFRRITWGHPVIMGRRTFESIGRPLPGRANVVLSRSGRSEWPGELLVCGSLDAALERLRDAEGRSEVFVIGGGEVYLLALPRTRRLYLTRVEARVDGDARFPDLDPAHWRLTEDTRHAADEHHAFAFRFQTYERTAPPVAPPDGRGPS